MARPLRILDGRAFLRPFCRLSWLLLTSWPFFCSGVIDGRVSSRLAAGGRLVSVADLHGDYERSVAILAAARLIDAHTLAWTGGNATLVQTGDIVDRGADGEHIFELFLRLRKEAAAAGGSVVNLLGNHELMNIQEDLRYVSALDVEEFGGSQKRLQAWSPQGWLGQQVRHFPAAVLLGRVLFAHAGVLPNLLSDASGRAHGLDELNAEMAQAIRSRGSPNDPELKALLGDEGPVWTRLYAGMDEVPHTELCADASLVLERLGAVRMVLGHTVQESAEGVFRVRADCQGKVVLADTGISRAYGGEMSFVEHDGKGGAVAVYPRTGERHTLQVPPNAHGVLLKKRKKFHV